MQIAHAPTPSTTKITNIATAMKTTTLFAVTVGKFCSARIYYGKSKEAKLISLGGTPLSLRVADAVIDGYTNIYAP